MDTRLALPGYHPFVSRCRLNERGGGVGLFIKDSLQYTIREDLSIFLPHVFESLFVETQITNTQNVIIGVIYRPNTAPRADLDLYSSTLYDIMGIINNGKNHVQ